MLIATKNSMGYMSTTLDPISQKFVDKFTKSPGKVLDIGAAYGVTSHPCLKAGCHVTAVDLEKKHLDELKQTAPKSELLTTIVGAFPQDIDFPDETFDGVIISRVLHFLEGEVIIDGLKKIKKWLKPGGQVYVVTETPFIKTLGRLREDYLERKANGEVWPGSFHDFPSYETPGMQHLHEYLNVQDKDTLSMAFNESSLDIQEITYMHRPDFPESMHLDGRESIGAIAVKTNS